MESTVTDHANYVEQAAALMDLTIQEEHRPGVLSYFALAAGIASRVMSFELAPVDESANTFEPVAPEAGPPAGAAAAVSDPSGAAA